MKSVLISIQPYWVFLIIAKAMGLNIDIAKTVEVRKNYPKANDWDETVKIYCSKDKKSFARIPKEYQPLMQLFLGKVIGEFVCDAIYDCRDVNMDDTCLTVDEWLKYTKGHKGVVYGWHISNLVIYDEPKKLSVFRKPCVNEVYCESCAMYNNFYDSCGNKALRLKRPPQSWCYVEALV